MTLMCLLLVGSLLIYFFSERRPSDATESFTAVGVCPSCQEPIGLGQVHCPRCQTPIWSQCSHCGQPVQTAWRLCPNCGIPLDGTGSKVVNSD